MGIGMLASPANLTMTGGGRSGRSRGPRLGQGLRTTDYVRVGSSEARNVPIRFVIS